VTDGDVSFDEHERLALALLAVEAGDFADVKEAMKEIIASAPDGADVALILSLALAHAGDRALSGQASVPLSRNGGSPRGGSALDRSLRTTGPCRRVGGLPARCLSSVRQPSSGGWATSPLRLITREVMVLDWQQ